MKTEPIEIIDRGRGAQLSTSRVTVQDLVPYFQERCSYEEIIRWIPTLTAAEIAVAERYYRDHQVALDKEDRLIRERSAENKNPLWGGEGAGGSTRGAFGDHRTAAPGGQRRG
jgi:uncharacterized protein (DUF433 family)